MRCSVAPPSTLTPHHPVNTLPLSVTPSPHPDFSRAHIPPTRPQERRRREALRRRRRQEKRKEEDEEKEKGGGRETEGWERRGADQGSP
eukprot:3938753-Rhodomonas_salina.1